MNETVFFNKNILFKKEEEQIRYDFLSCTDDSGIK